MSDIAALRLGELQLPRTLAFQGRVQRAVADAAQVVADSGVTDDWCAGVCRVWSGDQGNLRYEALERQLIEGGPVIFGAIDAKTFRLISAVLLVGAAHALDAPDVRGSEGAFSYWLLWAYRYALNVQMVEPAAIGRRAQRSQQARAAQPRKDWGAVDRVIAELRSTMSQRNLAGAVARRTGLSATAVRRHLKDCQQKRN